MTNSTKTDLKKRALMAVRDYGIHLTLFRNAMNDRAGTQRNRHGMSQASIHERHCHTL